MAELLEKMSQTLHQHRQEHLRKQRVQELALQFQRSQLLRKMKAPQQLVQLKQPQIKLSLQILYVKQLLKKWSKASTKSLTLG